MCVCADPHLVAEAVGAGAGAAVAGAHVSAVGLGRDVVVGGEDGSTRRLDVIPKCATG